MARQLMDKRVKSAVRATIEGLEERKLMATFSNSGAGVTIEEFFVAGNTTVRMVLGGDITVEVLSLEVQPGSDSLTDPIDFGLRTLIDPIPAAVQAPTAPVIGADIFKIYISAATEDSYISIAQVANQSTGNTPRPMQPFGGGPNMSIVDLEPGGDLFEATTFPTGVGAVYIGARNVTFPTTPPVNAGIYPALQDDFQFGGDSANRPIITYGDQDGDGAVGAIGVMPAPANGVLTAGIETAPGVTIGKILIGGVVTGNVRLGGSIDTFYAGALLTGNARGVLTNIDLRDADQVFGSDSPADPNSIVDNFFVDGDIRNLITGTSIGTDQFADAGDPISARRYNTGADIRVTGRIGQVLTLEDFWGGVKAEAGRPATELQTHIREVEFRDGNRAGGATYFQEGFIGEANMLAALRNDSFTTQQNLYSYFDSGLGENDVIVVDGSLAAATAPGFQDFNDYYGLPLIAGQTVSIDLDVNPARNSAQGAILQIGVFDPDGRLIATDFVHRTGNLVSLTAIDVNAPFQVTATRPGIYRLAIGTSSDFEFDGPTTQRESVTYGGAIADYSFIVRGAADINLGAVEARANLLTDVTADDTITVLDGDLGAIIAGDKITQIGVIDSAMRRFYVAAGNLRAMNAASIGYLDDDTISILGTPYLHVRKGAVGLVRTTGTGANDLLTLNWNQVRTDLNATDADPDTGFVDRTQAVGVDYQWIDSNTQILGNFIAKRAIGVIRAADLSHVVAGAARTPSFYVVNSDSTGSDGIIGMIDTPGDFGNGTSGGIAIDTGSNGNVRFVNVGGGAYKDQFFGSSASPELTTIAPNTSTTVTDDSGTDYTLQPLQAPTQRGFGQPVSSNGTTNGQITYSALPIRSVSGARAGFVMVNVTSTTGLRVTSGSRSGNATIDIGDITVQGNTTTTNQLRLEMTGSSPVSALNITGNAFTTISNGTNGELLNINAASITTLSGNTIGITPMLNGIALLPFSSRLPDTYPFTDQRISVNVTGNVTTVSARQGLGNLAINGNVTTMTANSDGRGTSGVFEGVNEPVFIGGTLTTLNIGEGILPTGSGQAAQSGVFVVGTISTVVNQGLGSDIRGDVISNAGIGAINLTDGAIINADIGGIGDFEDATNLNQGLLLSGSIGTISLSGVGGIIGSSIQGNVIDTVRVNGGFGMISSTVNTAGDTEVNRIDVDGYGIRSSLIDGGSRVNQIVANGSGKRLDTLSYTSSVRLSEDNSFDPFFGTAPNGRTDLHLFLGTTESAPKRKGVSNQGVIADSQIVASESAGTIAAWQIQSRDPFIRNPGFPNDGTPIPFTSNQFPMRISFGQTVDTIRTTSDIVGLSLNSGGLNLLQVGGAVDRASIGVSGRVNNISIGGTFRGTSLLQVTGPDGALVNMTTGGSVFGQVAVALGLANVTVGGDFGSPSFLVTRNIDNVSIAGDVLTGSRLRSKRTIGTLDIGGDVQAGATIQAKVISNQSIDGDVFGNIIITG